MEGVIRGVAIWGVQQILNAPAERVVEIAANCFPDMPSFVLNEILQHPDSVEFSEDGNTIVSGSWV